MSGVGVRPVAEKHNPFQSPGAVGLVSFTIGTESSNAINVAIQFKNSQAQALAAVTGCYMFLSSSATSPALVSSAPSGGAAIGTNGTLHTVTTGKAWFGFCNTSGQIDITITESSATTFYLWLLLPNGKTVVSSAITFA